MFLYEYAVIRLVPQVEREDFLEQMRGVATPRHGALEVVIEQRAIGRVGAVGDDQRRPFARSETAQVGEAMLGDEDVDVVLAMVDMGDHGYNRRDQPRLGG